MGTAVKPYGLIPLRLRRTTGRSRFVGSIVETRRASKSLCLIGNERLGVLALEPLLSFGITFLLRILVRTGLLRALEHLGRYKIEIGETGDSTSLQGAGIRADGCGNRWKDNWQGSNDDYIRW